jgi:putative oxidoreductase
MNSQNKLRTSLLLMRLTVFLVIFMWTLDKLINPGHAVKVFEHFYLLEAVSFNVMYLIGSIEMGLLLLFLIGYKKTFTYGFVLLIHFVSTFSAFAKYLEPFNGNLLFFAAWPMLAACVALFLLRDQDTLFSVSKKT